MGKGEAEEAARIEEVEAPAVCRFRASRAPGEAVDSSPAADGEGRREKKGSRRKRRRSRVWRMTTTNRG